MKNYRISLNLLITIVLSLFFFSCDQPKKQFKKSDEEKELKTSIKYAKGFDIQQYSGYKKLIIKSPYPDAEQYQEFILVNDRKTDFEG